MRHKMELLSKINEEVQNGTVTEYKEVDARLAELRETYGSEVPDASTTEGYGRSKSIASEMTKLRTSLEKSRKEMKAPVLAFGKMIDSEAKRLTSEISSIEIPFKEAYKAIDDEKKRIKLEIEDRIISIKDMPTLAIEKHSSEIEIMIDELAESDISKERFGRRVDEVAALVALTLEQLTNRHVQAIEREVEAARVEAERVELEKLRREQVEREESARLAEENAEREAEKARIETEAAERARQEEIQRQQQERELIEQEKQDAIKREQKAKREAEEAEQRRIEQERKAEANRIAAEEKAKRDTKEAAEAARKAEVQRQKDEQEHQRIEQEKLEANKRHVGKICKQSKEDIIAIGIDEETAKKVVSAIAKNQIRNLTINY